MKFLPHILITVLYIVVVAVVALGMDWEPLSPNAIGDFLAGAFSPLAFYWFILTAFLQRAELRETREQFERQANAAEELADLHSKRNEREEAVSIRAKIDAALPTIPDRVRKLSKIIANLPIDRNGSTGQRLTENQKRETEDIFPPPGVSSVQEGASAAYARHIREKTTFWDRNYKGKFGSIGMCWLSTDDLAAKWIREEWKSLLTWHMNLYQAAESIDEIRFKNAAERQGLEDLRYVFFLVFPPSERSLWEDSEEEQNPF